jgi:hypothetical protein
LSGGFAALFDYAPQNSKRKNFFRLRDNNLSTVFFDPWQFGKVGRFVISQNIHRRHLNESQRGDGRGEAGETETRETQ